MKFYFLCEGEREKAEYQFFAKVMEEYHTGENYELQAASGKDNIEAIFFQMKKNFKQGDSFILFFDNIETIGKRLVVDILSDIQKQCDNIGVSFKYTTYYCFEEIFLAYHKILKIINTDEETLFELGKVQENILTGRNYFKEDISFWQKRFVHRKGVLRTRESLSAGICNDLFNLIKGSFYLQKDKIGSCWILNCSDSSLHENVCKNCRYELKDSTFRRKLEDLDENSISVLTWSLKKIFEYEK